VCRLCVGGRYCGYVICECVSVTLPVRPCECVSV
jgi:hypothetical protein